MSGTIVQALGRFSSALAICEKARPETSDQLAASGAPASIRLLD